MTSKTEHSIGAVTCRSVVVAVRGTATMEDVITDSVAAPDLLDRSEWLPESFKQQQAQTGLFYSVTVLPGDVARSCYTLMFVHQGIACVCVCVSLCR